MASFIITLGILILCWNGLSPLARFMMIGALVVMFFGYGTLASMFSTRSQRDYLPAKPTRWKR